MTGRLSPRDRYDTDVAFAQLVDTFLIAITQAVYTPTEIREAAMLAQIIYESHQLPRPLFFDPDMEKFR